MGWWDKAKSVAKGAVETAADAATFGTYSTAKEGLGLGESSSVIDGARDYAANTLGLGGIIPGVGDARPNQVDPNSIDTGKESFKDIDASAKDLYTRALANGERTLASTEIRDRQLIQLPNLPDAERVQAQGPAATSGYQSGQINAPANVSAAIASPMQGYQASQITVPTSTRATDAGPVERFQAAQVATPATTRAADAGAVKTYEAANIAAPQRVQAPNLAPVALVRTPEELVAERARATGPGTVNIDTAQSNQARDLSTQAIQSIQEEAAGKGVGAELAHAQLTTAMARIAAERDARAGMARGAGRLALLRDNALAAGRDGTEAAFKAAELGLTNQLGARQQLTQAIQGLRATDVDVATKQAELNQQRENISAQLATAVSQGNAQEVNRLRGEEARLKAEAANLNASAQNRRAEVQGEQLIRVDEGNVTRAYDRDKTVAGLQTDAAKFGAQATNQRADDLAARKDAATQNDAARALAAGTTNASLQQDAAKTGATAANERGDAFAARSDTATQNDANRLLSRNTTQATEQNEAARFGASEANRAELDRVARVDTAATGNAGRGLTRDISQAGLDSDAARFGVDAGNRSALDYAGRADTVAVGNATRQSGVDVERSRQTIDVATTNNAQALETDKARDAATRGAFDSTTSASSSALAGASNALSNRTSAATGYANAALGQRTAANAEEAAADKRAAGNREFLTESIVPLITSDRRAKENVTDLDPEALKKFARAIASKVKAFEYKPGEGPEGTHVGPMAQDLEAAGPLGRALVSRRPDGTKQVDQASLANLMLAAAFRSKKDRS